MATDTLAAYHLPPDGSREQLTALGVAIRWLARGDETAGRCNLAEYTAPPRFAGPALHRHDDHDELFYVIGGRLTVRLGDDIADVGPGGFAFGPRGTAHTFANRTDEPVRFLFGLLPAGLEDMFREIMAYADEAAPDIDPARMDEINARHGVVILGPPLPATNDA